MLYNVKQFAFASLAMLGGMALQSTAQAGDYSNSAAYNSPIGMQSGQENATVNASLRDSNGNLSVVNGQFTSSSTSQQSGVQTASSSMSSGAGSGGGTSSAGAMFGGATAIGNSLNVITTGSNNTVIVTATQTNNGNQNASVSLNGH